MRWAGMAIQSVPKYSRNWIFLFIPFFHTSPHSLFTFPSHLIPAPNWNYSLMGELGSKALVRPLHGVARMWWYELGAVETRMDLPLMTIDGCQVRPPDWWVSIPKASTFGIEIVLYESVEVRSILGPRASSGLRFF
ncbi:hypothetical protein BDV24DRAFT_76263 [Aspergillus arachidicola]|uniref:Uncharacterized protein n=1 Tax=Aspergillus arachidicola TaxID=656916 RepID=A0A5N6Y1H5_9EURO|nr:hypothetical protein BDV24DRAFT_76263 [Aspergillus arachidicola]